MSDDKKNVGKQDDIRVDSKDPSEVEYLHRRHPDKTHQQIMDAIKNTVPCARISKRICAVKLKVPALSRKEVATS